ncbi:MAG: hypothetical protein L3J22_05690, partial [Xanthomonadales bacterium]|nr:hypothetical protein [Xanthomonadales bacterium]
QSYPIVGQARGTLYKKISFLKSGGVRLIFVRALYSGRTKAAVNHDRTGRFQSVLDDWQHPYHGRMAAKAYFAAL